MLPEKGVPSAVVWTVRRWCPDYVVEQLCATVVHSAMHTHMNRPNGCLLVRFSFSAVKSLMNQREWFSRVVGITAFISFSWFDAVGLPTWRAIPLPVRCHRRSTVSRASSVEGSTAPSVSSPEMDEEMMGPGHWLGSMLCVPFSALTPTVGRQEGIRSVKYPHFANPKRFCSGDEEDLGLNGPTQVHLETIHTN